MSGTTCRFVSRFFEWTEISRSDSRAHDAGLLLDEHTNLVQMRLTAFVVASPNLVKIFVVDI